MRLLTRIELPYRDKPAADPIDGVQRLLENPP
jgi:hypothetical protein